MKSKNKTKNLRLKPPLLNVARSMGKWKPSDDYLLIQSVLQLSCLKATHHCTKFSSNFSLKEIQERWYAILYDPPISKLIYKKLQTLHPDDVERLKIQAPFSDTEHELIAKLTSKKLPSLEELNELLLKNRDKFHESRSVNSLKDFWLLLKQYKLLNDSEVDNILHKEQATNQNHQNDESSSLVKDDLDASFEEKEDALDDKEIMENVNLDVQVEEEMCQNYKKILKQIKKAESELFLWQVLADNANNKTNVFENVDCLAVIKCDNTEYLMRKREITFGRSTENVNVDLDFSTIGSAKKISRNHGSIKLSDNCTFYLYNYSKKPVYVDGKIVLKSCKTQLFDKSIIQIDDFSLLFLINFNTITSLASENRQISLKKD